MTSAVGWPSRNHRPVTSRSTISHITRCGTRGFTSATSRFLSDSETVNEADELGISLRYAAAIGPALTIGASDAYTGALAVAATDPDIQFTLDVGDAVVIRCDVIDVGAPCLRGTAAELIEALSIRSPLPEGTPDEWHVLARGLATVFDTELESRA